MKQKNPFDKFPLLETQEGVLFDTLAICRFLADGNQNLLGSSRVEQARIMSEIKTVET